MTPAYLVDVAVVSSTCEKTLVCAVQLSEVWQTACEPIPRLLQMVREPCRTAEHARKCALYQRCLCDNILHVPKVLAQCMQPVSDELLEGQ